MKKSLSIAILFAMLLLPILGAGQSDTVPFPSTSIGSLTMVTSTPPVLAFSTSATKEVLKLETRGDSLFFGYENIDLAAKAFLEYVIEKNSKNIIGYKKTIDSLSNNKCGLLDYGTHAKTGSITKWKDEELFSIGLSGDMRVMVLGQEICDPNGVLSDYIDFGHKFLNMQFLTLDPDSGEQDYATYSEIKELGLLVKHYKYEECCYPFHRDSWIPAKDIDKYHGYFWPNGGPYVLVGDGK